ncbi:MAG: hypothetical protein AB7H90_19560 [Alphaproteobacteria bacterium]
MGRLTIAISLICIHATSLLAEARAQNFEVAESGVVVVPKATHRIKGDHPECFGQLKVEEGAKIIARIIGFATGRLLGQPDEITFALSDAASKLAQLWPNAVYRTNANCGTVCAAIPPNGVRVMKGELWVRDATNGGFQITEPGKLSSGHPPLVATFVPDKIDDSQIVGEGKDARRLICMQLRNWSTELNRDAMLRVQYRPVDAQGN